VVRNTINAKTDNHQLKRIWDMDNKAREINSPVIKQLLDETTPEELNKIDAEMTNNKQQTAVEWLVEQFKEYDFADVKDTENYIIKMQSFVLTEKLEQAKEMEKEQIAKAFDDGDYNYHYSRKTGDDFENGKEYFNELYK
jgi:hypothetical protein